MRIRIRIQLFISMKIRIRIQGAKGQKALGTYEGTTAFLNCMKLGLFLNFGQFHDDGSVSGSTTKFSKFFEMSLLSVLCVSIPNNR